MASTSDYWPKYRPTVASGLRSVKRGSLGRLRPVSRGLGIRKASRTSTTVPIAVHCTIVTVDIEGFGDPRRTNVNQWRVRRGMYGALRHAFDDAGIRWDFCRREDRGDGVLVLAPADVPKTLFVDRLPGSLVDALVRHNRGHPTEEQIRLRLAVNAGEITYDDHGVTASSITHTFRLLDTDELRAALAVSTGVLAIISSTWFFDEVIRQSEASHASAYRPVVVTNKETTAQAWIRQV